MNNLIRNRMLRHNGCLMANTTNGKTHQQTRSEIWIIRRKKEPPGNYTQSIRPWKVEEGGETRPAGCWQGTIHQLPPSQDYRKIARLLRKTHDKETGCNRPYGQTWSQLAWSKTAKPATQTIQIKCTVNLLKGSVGWNGQSIVND